MQISICPSRLVLGLAVVGVSGVLGQGSLTPSGAPAPTTKTLDQMGTRTPISSLPFTAASAGSYYLTKTLTGTAGDNGISVTHDNVSIDLNGFALVGVPQSLDGIACGNIKNFELRNGVVSNWGAAGVDANGASACRYESLRVTGNGAFGLATNANCRLTACIADSNSAAGLVGADNCTFTGCTARNQGTYGLTAGSAAIFVDCCADTNGYWGFYLGDGCVMRGCVSRNNAAGITAGMGASITDCSVTANSADGIQAGNNCRLTDCILVSGGGPTSLHGISTGVVASISGCVVQGFASGTGILSGDHALVEHCHVNGNSVGITVSDFSVVRDNTLDYQGGVGIRVRGTQNRVEGNNLTRNNVALVVPNAHNIVLGNSASGNKADYNIAAGNSAGPVVTSAHMGANTNPSANFSY